MARKCSVCLHPERAAIDKAILAGAKFRDLGRKYQLAKSSLYRHKDHVAESLKKAKAAADVAHADDLMAQVLALMEDARKLQATATRKGDIRGAIQALRVRVEHLALLAKLRGDLPEDSVPGTTHVTLNVLDQETAVKMAQVFVQRHGSRNVALPAPAQPATLEGECSVK